MAASRDCECEVDVVALLLAPEGAAEPVHPGLGAPDHPAVAAQAPVAVLALARDAGRDAALAALRSAAAAVIGHLEVIPRSNKPQNGLKAGLELLGPAAGTAWLAWAHVGDGVQRRPGHHAAVPFGPAQDDAKRRAACVGDEVPLHAGTAAVSRVWPYRP